MYTSHGHHIVGTIKSAPPEKVARCGGPGLCELCSKESLFETLQKKETPNMVETTTYVRKPFEVEAVEVTEENMEAVKDWCQGVIESDNRKFIRVRVTRVLNERQTKAYPGDWVLYASTGFKVYTAKAFHKTFEKPDGEAKDRLVQASKQIQDKIDHQVVTGEVK